MNGSFDFDGTLHRDGRPLWPAMGLLRWHYQAGHRVMIVTTRTESRERAAWRRVHEPDRIVLREFLRRYGQVTLIKANRAEAMGVAAEETGPLAMARRLADEHRCSVVVTYGGHGMVAAEREGGTWYLPAEAADVRYVCGAGDTVLAALGAGMLDGHCLRRACRRATRAGGRQVAELKIAAVNPY